jgi:uncharacterized protein (DUF58 family)
MKLLRSLFLTNRLFIVAGICVLGFVLAFSWPIMLIISKLFLVTIIVSVVADVLVLYLPKNGFTARRLLPEKFSNGDLNDVTIYAENNYGFDVSVKIIDEIPNQFQVRDFLLNENIKSKETRVITYQLRPVKRGEYVFGAMNIYVRGNIGLIERRYTFEQGKMVRVYPSFLQMRKYELLAIHHNLTDLGIKRILKIGHTMEFEQIKNYVRGDDYRTVNWPATARKAELMVNQFQDERSQHIYSIIDKGRLMKMPFEGLSLLDYAINASLVLSNIAIRKEDKAGLITFSDKMSTMLPPDKRASQMNSIMEALYHQKTLYLESDYERLYATIRSKINQRSLLILYTNFESLASMQRNLKYLKAISRNHVLVVVFFVNTELNALLELDATTVEDIYTHTVADKFDYEKRQIVKELNRYNIYTILTPPAGLTVQVINKYLEIKARGII